MKHIVWDIEGNGLGELVIDKKKNLIPEVTKVHLLVLRSYPDGRTLIFRNRDGQDEIPEGLQILQSAQSCIGHNIIEYDMQVLRRLYDADFSNCRVFDTLVASRLVYPDEKNHPFGGNSVENYGNLFNEAKVGTEIEDWSQWTQLMEDRCVQDCVLQHKIFDYIKPRAAKFPFALRLEHRIAEICANMQENGVSIDVPAAEELIEQLELEFAKANDQLQEAFPPIVEEMKTPQYYYDPSTQTRYERKKDAPAKLRKQLEAGPMKTKEHPFNPGSTLQIAQRFKERYDFDAPTTENGNPTLAEEVLKSVPFPEAKLLLRAQMADKRLQHLRDWTTRARASRTPGRIHPRINPDGCNTHRATHSQPNQTACPKIVFGEEGILTGFEGRYGFECRSLWGPRPTWWQVGGDASGLELRELGHSLFIFDGGAYAQEVIDGDIHTLNQNAGGLITRDQAKTVIYAYLYGAGDEHIGELITAHASLPIELIEELHAESQSWVRQKSGRDKSKWLKLKGRQFRDQFERKIPALAQLTAWCKQCASERGFIPLLDGRRAPCRSAHSALNVLLQGNGAVTMKVAMAILARKLEDDGILWTDCAWMLWPHDEFQFEAKDEKLAHHVGKSIVDSIVEAGVRLKLKCPLDGEYKVGKNWADCH